MIRVLIASLVTMTLAGSAAAQSQPAAGHWPERPIHFIVPFPAGSSSDIVARIVAQQLTTRLGQQLVVENRPGASGNLATEFVAHAQRDGYTLGLANTSTLALSPSLMAHPTYDPIKDFAPISMLGASPFVLAAFPGLPVHDVQGLIAKAKAEPGKLTYGEAGPATLANLSGLLFNKLANVQLTPVSYRGSEQEVVDVIAGRVDTAYLTIPPTLQLIRDGKVRAIAVTGAKRSPIMPDVPTIAESGLPGYESVLWQAIYAPAGTPPAVLARLNKEVNTILHEDGAIAALGKIGVEAEPSSQDEFAARLATEIKKWREVIVAAGIKPQ
jgi:tripartite-type tricarboxylate transporter receptor subunit TctC